MALIVRDITAGYGQLRVLNKVSLEVRPGTIHCVFGPNGSGKSTLLKVCAGMLRPWSGTLELDSQNLVALEGHQYIRSGIVTVPQGGGIFLELSVAENLVAGGLALKDRAVVRESLEAIYARFPILAEKRRARGSSLSGGQRMLLAFARALVSRPKVLLLDEPSAGLAPLVVKEVFSLVKDLRAQGPAILLIEQAVRDALPLADQVTVLAQGEVQFQGTAEGLSEAKLAEAYLGVKL